MIAVVVGTRPEIIKMAPLVWALRHDSCSVIDTGQHVLDTMSKDIFEEMQYEPTHKLTDYSFGRTVDALVPHVKHASMVVVQGDTWSCLAGAIAALHVGVPVAHLESGLRSGDAEMVEERNRMMVDDLASVWLTYDDTHTAYLAQQLRDGWAGHGTIVQVGNPLIDVIERFRSRIAQPVLGGRSYAYLTLHRPELTNDGDRLGRVLAAIEAGLTQVALPVIFPVHPRTEDRIRRYRLRLPPLLARGACQPLSAIDSLRTIRHARVVVTDSGGIQEEALALCTRCVTVRENTERPETLTDGRNCVTGFDPVTIRNTIVQACAHPPLLPTMVYGAPGVGQRILAACEDHHGQTTRQ